MKKRLAGVRDRIGTKPVALAIERQAYATFCETGELPEADHVTRAVVNRLRRGYEVPPEDGTAEARHAAFRAAVEAPTPVKDTSRDALLLEALHPSSFVRFAARFVLRKMIEAGWDPAHVLFLQGPIEAPAWGFVGMHVFGFTEEIGKPPYEHQAARLCQRFTAMRKGAPQRESWIEALAEAVSWFRQSGELPDDEPMREWVLLDAELVSLLQHALGADVARQMAAFDELAAASAEARGAVVAQIQVMAAAGRFAPKEGSDA